jgi:hypothetical protein
VAVHDVEVEKVCAGLEGCGGVAEHEAKVGREDGGGDEGEPGWGSEGKWHRGG